MLLEIPDQLIPSPPSTTAKKYIFRITLNWLKNVTKVFKSPGPFLILFFLSSLRPSKHFSRHFKVAWEKNGPSFLNSIKN